MVRKSPRQETIPGTDTPLSIGCDEYIEISRAIEKGKILLDEKRKELVELFKAHRKTSIKHNGVTLYLKEGQITKDTIAIKSE